MPRFASVDAYLAAQPAEASSILRKVRGLIRGALPRSEEVISYGIPAYNVNGKIALYFAGWKTYYSLYPAGRRLVAHFKEELREHDVKGSTIRFAYAEPVPAQLIRRIARFRADELTKRP